MTSSASKRRPGSVAPSSKTNTSVSQVSQLSRRPGIPLPPSAPSGDDLSQKMLEIKIEIEKIEDKIASLGGFHCGWTPSDHEDFLRVKTKHKHKTDTLAFLNEILGLIPDCNIDKVKEHIANHKQYVSLCKEKKELLQKYKQEKIVQRNTKLQKLDSRSSLNGSHLDENSNGRLMNRGGSAARAQKGDQFSKEYREQQKQKVEEWKKVSFPKPLTQVKISHFLLLKRTKIHFWYFRKRRK